MQFGVFMFPTDFDMSIVDLARAAEDRGFESLWVPEHTHIPVSRRTPWPGGADLPHEYAHALDPFVALGAAAAVTTRLRLGTGVCLVIERDPIGLAKEVATLDYLSDGRFLFGIGGGWNFEEMENHGTDPARRWSILRERVMAIKHIWTHAEAEYHGALVNFDPIWQWPKPVQQPHPPIIVGGNGPRTLKRVIDYGDGWAPIIGRGPELTDRMAELATLAAETGREPIPVTIFSLRGTVQETVERYHAAGASRFVFGLPPAGSDIVLRELDRLADVARSFEVAAAV
jgi:probable F420-dependent oxidoreductase